MQHFSATIRSDRAVVVNPGITLELGAELFVETEVNAPSSDLDQNFVESVAYDEFNRTIGATRTYFDDAGNPLQTQFKALTNGQVMASATIYDKLGRPAISTLPAPVTSNVAASCPNGQSDVQIGANFDFKYNPDFVLAENGQRYDYTHFDGPAENNPNPLDENVVGSLGWYYSHENVGNAPINEPHVAVTDFPYSRTLYHGDGSGEVKGATRPGDLFKAGSNLIATSNREKVTNDDPYFNLDFDSYLSMREREFGYPRPTTIDGEFFKTTAVDEMGKRAVTYHDKGGKVVISLYFGVGNSPITKSYSFYDYQGRLLASISPNGLSQYQVYGDTSNFAQIDKTRYFYDNRGLLATMEEKIAGSNASGVSRTYYIYRLDGSIRFSQNEEQRKANKFSYTHYDQIGRPVESGEYTPNQNGIRFASEEMKAILENTSADGGLAEAGGSKSEVMKTFYDMPDPNIPIQRVQKFVRGAVSYTKYGGLTSWYSYDEQGRIEWLAQDIPTLGVKTIDYRYDPNGQVQEVAFQKDNITEHFAHYYEYDYDGRLHKVYTTRQPLTYDINGLLTNVGPTVPEDAITFNADRKIVQPGFLNHQATYIYYLHGALKRVELASRNNRILQGIDYTYTVDGALKSINHANPDKDPGYDGSSNSAAEKDIFGMTLEYYPNDYVSAESGPTSPSENVTFGVNASNQYAGLIKASRWFSPIDVSKQFAYTYQYDQRNQFSKSVWGTVQGSLFVSNPFNSYHEGVDGYDLNGNILSMERKGNQTALSDPILHDLSYSYLPFTNILDSVANGNEMFRRYAYNDIGQMTVEVQADTSRYVAYNVSGKVTGVYADASHTKPITTFDYDDKGFRLGKTTYDSLHQPRVKFWYIRDASGSMVAMYEQTFSRNEIKLTELPVYGNSRLGVYKPSYGLTFYELTDHLGNVRAVIGEELELEYVATMESERKTEETVDFSNVVSSSTASYINHTPYVLIVDSKQVEIRNPNEVNRINNRPHNVANPNPIGTGIMLWVHPGDTIEAEAFAKYANFTSSNRTAVVSLPGYLSGVFGAGTVIDGGSVFDVMTTQEFAGLTAWSKLNDNHPRAFLNYILFDADFKFQDFDFDQVSNAAEIPATNPSLHSHERLHVSIPVHKEGYVYIYVSNEADQNMDVYFDDLRVKHKFSNIVAGGDYYPFGLPITDRQITREAYRYGYQGQFAEKDEETGWNHFELREYDPIIGRTITTDPARQFHSPYMWVGNNPVSGTDPTGGVSPIYDMDGNFLGTDDQGLQGEAIFMDASHFTQGMSHESALEAGFTFSQFHFFDINLEASAAVFNHQNGLSSRPDWDGFVTIDEGVAWALAHPGALQNPTADNSLYINSGLLDFGDVSTSSFAQLNTTTPVNLFSASNTYNSTSNETLRATVYALGRVNMQLIHRGNRQIRIVNDDATDYDWNRGGGFVRDNFIRAERARTGINDSHGFKAYYYGIGTLRK